MILIFFINIIIIDFVLIVQDANEAFSCVSKANVSHRVIGSKMKLLLSQLPLTDLRDA